MSEEKQERASRAAAQQAAAEQHHQQALLKSLWEGLAAPGTVATAQQKSSPALLLGRCHFAGDLGFLVSSSCGGDFVKSLCRNQLGVQGQ